MNHHKIANSILLTAFALVMLLILAFAIKQSTKDSLADYEKKEQEAVGLREKVIEACFQKGGVPILGQYQQLKDCKL